jgi:chitodextrinase/pimeloyl-ACP methyl ester carboxylesterase
MKKILLLIVGSFLAFASVVSAQANIFDPNDPVVNYNPSAPPALPPAGQIGKWVRTPRSTWNTDKFKSYYVDGMSFRLRYPNGYNPSDNTKKYPMILFFHGGGESANVYDNEYQLFLEAQKFQTMMDLGQWNGFLLFPQAQEGTIWDYFHFIKLNYIVDNLVAGRHLDADRVFATGLSMGGLGAIRYSAIYPTYSSIAVGSSPALVETMTDQMHNGLVQIPVWIANGGTDANPAPSSVDNFINIVRGKGGSVRHSFFPQEYHFVWENIYDNPDIIGLYNTAHKANPVVYYSKTQYPPNAQVNSKMGLTPGFAEYQWQRDNVDIPGANSNEYTATQLGTYRARFRRVPGGPWSDWSLKPARIFTADVVTGPGNVNGLAYKYYEGQWSSVPNFNTIAPVKSGVTANVDMSVRTPGRDDMFAFLWEGKLNVPTTGRYLFEIASDDGSKLYLNSYYGPNVEPLINNDNPHGDVPTMGEYVDLTGGSSIPFALAYFEAYGSENMKVYWTGPGIPRQEIPNSAFSSVGVPVDNTAPTVPTNLQSPGKGTTNIQLSWNASTDAVGVNRYDIFENGSSKYTTTGTTFNVTGLSPNTAYTYAVRAYDAAGNASALSTPLTVTTSQTPPTATSGLNYKYYEGDWDVLPNFNTLTPVKTGTVASVDLSMRRINDYFGVVWEAYLNIPTAGNYTFEIASDDGSKFYWNTFYNPGATALINNDGLHGDVPGVAGTVNNLAPGAYPISLAFFEKWGGENMVIYWSGPGIPKQPIPASAFTTGSAAPDTQAPSVPTGLTASSAGTTFINLSWNASSDNVAVARYDIFENNVLKYTSTSPNISVTGLSPNTTYTYAVRAADFAGNASGLSSSIAPKTSGSGTVSGINYRYYEGDWDVLPNFNNLTPIKTGTAPNINLSMRRVDDYFGVVWEGYLNIPTAGTYTFEIASDDGSKFYWNTFYNPAATALINNDGLHGDVPGVSATVSNIAAGAYPISLAFFEKWGGENMVLYWSGPGFSKQLVPGSAFSAPSVNAQTPFGGVANTRSSSSLMNDMLSPGTGKLRITEAYPNPFVDRFTIEYENPEKISQVDVQIYDLNGRLVMSKYFGALPVGTTFLKLDINGKQAPKGIYFARVNVDGVSAKLVKLIRNNK